MPRKIYKPFTAWDDDWEVAADRERSLNSTQSALESQTAPRLTKKEALYKHKEENKKLWQEAEVLDKPVHFLSINQPPVVVSSSSNASAFNPAAIKVLSRKPGANKTSPAPKPGACSSTGSYVTENIENNSHNSYDDEDEDDDDERKNAQLTPEELRRRQEQQLEEKQRRYDAARARIFGNSNTTISMPLTSSAAPSSNAAATISAPSSPPPPRGMPTKEWSPGSSAGVGSPRGRGRGGRRGRGSGSRWTTGIGNTGNGRGLCKSPGSATGTATGTATVPIDTVQLPSRPTIVLGASEARRPGTCSPGRSLYDPNDVPGAANRRAFQRPQNSNINSNMPFRMPRLPDGTRGFTTINNNLA